ncbi:MAG TPA: hypothetical protein VGJ28_17585 [Micromonosporaceae bacterium]|jgi:hypothetical protein
MTIQAGDAGAASWLLRSGADWWDLVRFGPPGYDIYARVQLSAESDRVGAALTTLTSCTAATTGFAAVWEGWTSTATMPEAPRIEIPHRTMLLFTGPVTALRNAPALAWYGSADVAQEPHLVWPEDRAWCLACEVDEEIEFTVGCSADAFEALETALPGLVRRVGYGEQLPLYRS